MDLDGDEFGEWSSDWAVPATALTHALRTPLNVLKGYATLLATGELGRIHPDAVAAVEEMRRAASAMEGAVDLLAPLAGPATGSVDFRPLTPVLDAALARHGFGPDHAGDFAISAVDWPGWPDLVAALAAMWAADGTPLIGVAAVAGGLSFAAAAPRVAAGDGRLAAMVAARRAAAGGLLLRLEPAGDARLEARGLIRAHGRTTYRREEVRMGS